MENSSQLDTNSLKILETMEEKSGKRIIPELAQMYLQSAPEMLMNMQTAFTQSKWEEIGRYAHTLKSSSAYLGATLIREICSEIEDYAHGTNSDKPKTLKPLIFQLNSALPQTLQEVTKLLNR